MKKESISGVIVYLLILAVALIYGLGFLQNHASSANWSAGPGLYLLYVAGSIVVGVILNAIVFELAHVAGAKVGGYKTAFVSILGFSWIRENEKMKFKFSNFDGLTGETKIYPDAEKSKEKDPNPLAFIWFGTLFYLIEIIIIIVLFALLTNVKSETIKSSVLNNWAYAIMTVGVVGFMILLYNIFPAKLDTPTDGYWLTLINNPANKAAFNELLRVQHELEMGNSDVEIKTFDEITNFTADLNLNKVYILFEKGQFSDAEQLLNLIINSKESVSEKVYLRAKAQIIYIHLLTKSPEEAQKYYEESVPVEERREISNDVSMASIRAYMLMSGILDKSRSECVLALNNVYKALKRTPKERQDTEIKLFNEVLQKICEAHPTWELEDYKLVPANKK